MLNENKAGSGVAGMEGPPRKFTIGSNKRQSFKSLIGSGGRPSADKRGSLVSKNSMVLSLNRMKSHSGISFTSNVDSYGKYLNR